MDRKKNESLVPFARRLRKEMTKEEFKSKSYQPYEFYVLVINEKSE